MSKQKPWLTRMAPTPSGFIHLGNAFNFITTALAAQLLDARVLLRIDDLDKPRYRSEYAEDLFESLDFLELDYDLGPADRYDLETNWSQQGRLSDYQDLLDELRNRQLVFACSCSRSEIIRLSNDGSYPGTCLKKGLNLDEPGVAWRLKNESQKPAMRLWPSGKIRRLTLPSEMKYLVVRRRDGLPSYHLASVVDDLTYGVNLVIRGQDLWSSSLGQISLAQTLKRSDFTSIEFFHHLLIMNDNGRKLSKSVLQHQERLRDRYRPEEIYRKYSRYIGLAGEVSTFKGLVSSVSQENIARLEALSS